MEIRVRRVGYEKVSPESSVVLSSQRLVGVSFRDRRPLQFFSSDGCRFERCDFSGAVIESASFGAGRRMSEYLDCNFDGAKLRMGPGGYARFEGCSFEKTSIESWFCFSVEIVNCVFSGRLKKVVFNGTVPEDDQKDIGRVINQFEGNDFSRATLIDVGFRTGVDLSKQSLPAGDEYIYIPDARKVLESVRVILGRSDDPAMQRATRPALYTLEEDVAGGQNQVLIRITDFPRNERPFILRLLEEALAM